MLLLADPVDEFWIPNVGAYDAKPFKSATRGGAELDKIELSEEKKQAQEPQPAGTDALIAMLRLALQDAVKDVRASSRLDTSAVCLVADEGDMDIHLERLLKQHRQLDSAVQARAGGEPAPSPDRRPRQAAVRRTAAPRT